MRKLERWAMQRGVTLDGVHVEAGISAGIPFNERPEGGRLWAELRKGDALVAAKLDRMFRSAGDCLAVIETFKARGVSLFLLDLNGGADDVSGNGIARLFLTIVSAFAEFERDRLGERIRATRGYSVGCLINNAKRLTFCEPHRPVNVVDRLGTDGDCGTYSVDGKRLPSGSGHGVHRKDGCGTPEIYH
jgi:hypothetical protein